MADAAESDGRARVRIALWIIAALIAAAGVSVAIVTASWWPLVLVGGLALPLIPPSRPHV